MTGYRRYYDVSKKKFVADDFETEIDFNTPDCNIEDWFTTPSAAEDSAYKMNKDLVSIEDLRETTDTSKFAVCICKECHKPFRIGLKEYWWCYINKGGLYTPKRCINCLLTEKCTNEEEIRADERQKFAKKIMSFINTGNRGNCDYFIVDQIENYIAEQLREQKEE